MNKLIINCQTSLKQFFYDSDLDYENNGEEIEVIVNNIPNLNDEELCSHYGIDYNQVNCITGV